MGILDRFVGKKSGGAFKAVTYVLRYKPIGGKWMDIYKTKDFFTMDDIEDPEVGWFKCVAVDKHGNKKTMWSDAYGIEKNGGSSKKKLEELIIEKIVNEVSFEGAMLSEFTLPVGNFTMKFVNPAAQRGANGTAGFIITEDGSQIPIGDMPPLTFKGELPVWLDPRVMAMMGGLVSKFGNVLKDAIGGAISEKLGIREATEQPKMEEPSKGEVIDKEYENIISELDEEVSTDDNNREVSESAKKKEVTESEQLDEFDIPEVS